MEKKPQRTIERKTVKKFNYEHFGFPVIITNAPMIRIRGEWVYGGDQGELQEAIAFELAKAPWRLTGYQIHFLRSCFLDMRLKEFAVRFGVTHPRVIQWERCGDEPTKMAWGTEKDIRLEAFTRIVRSKVKAIELWVKLKELAAEDPKPIVLAA